MNGQSFVLLAVGLFTSLVVAVATLNHYMLVENPPSLASGLLWRAENALSTVNDFETSLSSTDFSASGEPVSTIRMDARVIVRPVPALSLQYVAPDSVAGQIVTVENDLLSHYLPQENVVVVRRWSGLPLAAVGLASLDVARLRAQVQQGAVAARVVDSAWLFTAAGASPGLDVAETVAGTYQTASVGLDVPSPAVIGPSLSGLRDAPTVDLSDPLYGSYIVEVRDVETGDLSEALWIDRRTYFIQQITYYSGGRRVREIQVEGLVTNQGLTLDDLLIVPRGVPTIRG